MLPVISFGLSALLCAAAAAPPPKAAGGAEISDPFRYCKAAGTRDTVQPLPQNLKSAAAALLGLVRAAGDPEEYFWRCMDGAVFVCAIGANIPCRSKADRSRRNVGAEAFCRETGNADFVPAYAAGHGTIYEWRCVSGAAVRGKAIAQLDRRGFQRDFWHRLAPGGTG